MAIPDYQSIMLPLMKFAADRKEHALSDVREQLADEFILSEEERKQLLPSGTNKVFINRVGWAKKYLGEAGLLVPTGRGLFRITERGIKLLSEKPKKIDIKLLAKYPEFVVFKGAATKGEPKTQVIKPKSIVEQTPIEALEDAYYGLSQSLAQELLGQVKNLSPSFFEKLVVEVLVKMGYGGSRKDAGEATRITADGGIDGIIKEDPLGLDTIYIQAKRWEGAVGSPEMQKFAGALQGQKAKKGVFITTSKFSKDALEFISKIESKIVPIDGEKLAQLMIDHDIGVVETATYKIKKIDLDYFTEE